MKKQLFALASTFALLANPAGAQTERQIVNPTEQMVVVPGLEFVGPSRISTVEHCSAIEGLDWRNLITDSDFQLMQDCLVEHS